MASISKVDVYPVRTLFGALDFNLTLRNDPIRRVLLDSYAEVSIQDQFIGRAHQIGPDEAAEAGRSNDFYARMRLPLDPASIQAIEELRSARPLDLRVRFVLIGLNMDPNEAKGNAAFRMTIEQNVRIEKSRWVEEFLTTFGLHGYQMWELRFPQMTTPESLTAETDSLERAIHDYNQGDYADAFKDCREMVEHLQARKAELGLDSAVGTEEWGRAENYLAFALHARTGHQVVRADAEFAITLAQAIHRRVSHALANPKKAPAETVRLKA